jgi:uncharacterized protein
MSRDFEVIRDPLWSTIRLDPTAASVIDAPSFQRLRRVRQLGLAYLVYPGANHTRFDHAIGVYHLARQTIQILAERGELEQVDPVDRRIVPYAALLHDIGHLPFSHALEELETSQVPVHHEELTGRFLAEPALRDALSSLTPDAAERIEAMIRGRSGSPLQGLVSGSLDLDKIEYLKRDSRFCGVPYGQVDVDRLIHALTLLRDPDTGELEVGIHEKGISALESLLFAKYQMFRNVYWHHAVRSATALYKRLVQEAVDAGLIDAEAMVGRADEEFLALVEARAVTHDSPGARRVEGWLGALRERRLPKRAVEVPGELVRGLPAEEWYYSDGSLRKAVEDRLARDLGLPAGGVLLDYPEKPRMMGLGLLVRTRDGAVRRLEAGGWSGLIDLPRISEELYYSARVFRIFTTERREIRPDAILTWLRLPASELKQRLEAVDPLL